MCFPIPDLQDEYMSSPAECISHLIVREGEGSLSSELRGLGSLLAANGEIFAKGISLFQIVVSLSDDGLSHIEEVISLVFNHIGLLRRSGAIDWIHDELRKLSEISFRFMEKIDPAAAVIAYSSNLQRIPFRDILSWNLLRTEYKPDRIMEIIEMLSPKNMFYVVSAREYSGQEGNIHEPIFGTEMRILDINEVSFS
ncbi:hypothetical protein COOONC_01227 [Cooperia oncophora]